MKFKVSNKSTLVVLSLLSLVLVLILDLSNPLGYADWLLYIFPLLLIYLSGNSRMTYLLLALEGIGLIIGFYYSPVPLVQHNMSYVAAINRLTGFGVLLLFTLIINQLIQSQKRLRKISEQLGYANKELEAFSYSAAHDLKSPLTAMKGLSDLLLMELKHNDPDTQVQEYLKMISKSSSKMSLLIDDMLTLSRISLQEINVMEFNLSEMSEKILEDYRENEKSRQVEYKVESGIKIHGDQALLKIAMSNLLGNAWKYTARNEQAVIEVGIKKVSGKTTYFVQDNGCGFDMAQSGKLFEPFKRLHQESEFSGTGIGLSIVDRVIRRHGGEVWGESENGKGAIFYFTLPNV
jgi:light-regulated signal transduction histidine kinase (bacteriophytochrome)